MKNSFSISYVKAYEDHRGAVVYPFRDLGVDPAVMKNMHVVSISPGEARGNHLHPEHVEFILVTGAEVLATIIPPNGIAESISIGPEPTLVTIHPGVAHVFRNEGEYPCFLTCWYAGGADAIRTEPWSIPD